MSEKIEYPPGHLGELPNLRVVCTLGARKHSAKDFFGLLEQAEVTHLIDIRRRPDGALLGFARQRDLSYLLSVHNMRYTHLPILAPSELLLGWYKQVLGEDKETHDSKRWAEFTRMFMSQMTETKPLHPDSTDVQTVLRGADKVIALLCSEEDPRLCHRSMVANMIARWHKNIKVRHLTTQAVAKRFKLAGEALCVL